MSRKPIHVFAKWKVKLGQWENVLGMVKELRSKSVEEPGNLFYQAFEDRGSSFTLVLYEGYADEAALDFHRNSPHYVGLVVDQISSLLESREVVSMTPMEF